MKQITLICLIICLLYTVCNGQNTPITLTKEDFRSEPIKFEEAAKDIAQLLDHDTLGTLPTFAMGGMFCIDDFYQPTGQIATDTVQGTLMWYCMNRTTPSTLYPPLFLSIEPMHKDRVNFTLKPDRRLLRPTNPHVYTGPTKPTNVQTMQRYLTDFSRKLDCNIYARVFFPNVATQQRLINEFNTYIKTVPRATIPPRPYNLTDWAYFQNNYDKNVGEGTLTHLVKLPYAKYIRYYFGYDKGKTGKNSIRVILFAVTENGRNITTYVVQKSIPPARR